MNPVNLEYRKDKYELLIIEGGFQISSKSEHDYYVLTFLMSSGQSGHTKIITIETTWDMDNKILDESIVKFSEEKEKIQEIIDSKLYVSLKERYKE